MNDKARNIVKRNFYEDPDETGFPTDEEMARIHAGKKEAREIGRIALENAAKKPEHELKSEGDVSPAGAPSVEIETPRQSGEGSV